MRHIRDVLTKEEIVEAGMAIKKAKKIAVISPKNLDGDSIGACCALHIALRHLKKESRLICVEDIPDNMKFVPSVNEFEKGIDPSYYDLFIITDTAETKLFGLDSQLPELLNGEKPLINIDHHISNKLYGTINIVKPHMATATMVLYRLFRAWNVHITPDIATALMVGIYTDTGSFMHGNTTDEVYEVASKLISLGADIRSIVKYIFKTTPLSTMKLWGKVLSRARQNSEKITISYVTEQDFKEVEAKPDDLSGVVDFLNTIPDSYFSLLLMDFGGKIKGSLRTLRDDVNLSKIAAVFGGGGHAKASGFTIPGRLVLEEG